MLDPDGTVNADRMREEWFPELKCNVFLSHSHADENLARSFVEILAKLGITCFVDADVWGYIGELQRAIDDRWNKIQATKNYSYKGVLAASANVHMLLLISLVKMIDRCECLFFLNTPNSVSIKDAASGKFESYSPWLYGEAALSSLIRRRDRRSHRIGQQFAREGIDEGATFKYIIPLEHMHVLSREDLMQWLNRKPAGASEALDALYLLAGVRE